MAADEKGAAFSEAHGETAGQAAMRPAAGAADASGKAVGQDDAPDQAGAIEGQVGLGVDIVEIERMRRVLKRSPRFRERMFSEDERAYCDSKSEPEVHYATRFAAKEAVVKALGTGFSQGINPRDIEVKRSSKGRPFISLSGRAREVAREAGVHELPISLSFTHTDAVACAMAITEDSIRASEKRVDPMAELAQQFKEARALLDEMDAPGKAGVSGASGGADAPIGMDALGKMSTPGETDAPGTAAD